MQAGRQYTLFAFYLFKTHTHTQALHIVYAIDIIATMLLGAAAAVNCIIFRSISYYIFPPFFSFAHKI